jgi:hypothetical protein
LTTKSWPYRNPVVFAIAVLAACLSLAPSAHGDDEATKAEPSATLRAGMVPIDDEEQVSLTLLELSPGSDWMFAGEVASENGVFMAFMGDGASSNFVSVTWSESVSMMGKPFALWSDGMCTYVEWPANLEALMDVPLTENVRWTTRPLVVASIQGAFAGAGTSQERARLALSPYFVAHRKAHGVDEAPKVIPVAEDEDPPNAALAEELSWRFETTRSALHAFGEVMRTEFTGLIQDPNDPRLKELATSESAD